MRTVFVREIAELSPLMIALAVVAWITGVESVSGGSDYDGMLTSVIISGAAVGLIQGGLDRWRRDDLFFKHRPVGAIRFELARTVAGLVAVLAPFVVLVLAHRSETAWTMAEGWAAAYLRNRPVRQLSASETVLLGTGFLCTWASVRYAIARPNVWLALILCGGLPVVCWAIGSRFTTHAGAAAFAVVASVLFLSLSALDLAGDRR